MTRNAVMLATYYTCPECKTQKFPTCSKFRIHWSQRHTGRPPRPVSHTHKLDAKPPAPAIATEKSTAEDPVTAEDSEAAAASDSVGVYELLQDWYKCGRMRAKEIFLEKFRLPAVVDQAQIYHRRSATTNELQPMIDKNRSHLLRALFGAPQRSDPATPINHSSSSSAAPSSSRATPSARVPRSDRRLRPAPADSDAETPEFLASPTPKRQCLSSNTGSKAEQEAKDRAMRITSVQESIASLSDTLRSIKALPVDDDVKDTLRGLAIKAIAPDSAVSAAPPVVVSKMVREYLGYAPIVVYGGEHDVGHLYKSIGREARNQYIKLYGTEPKRRSYSEGGDIRETNNYSSNDRGWIAELVQEQCSLAGLYPRPRVLMSRGQDPKLFHTGGKTTATEP